MLPAIYQLSGVLVGGRYLPGQYSWPDARQLVRAIVTGQSPASGSCLLFLEIGGVLTDFAVTIPAGMGAFSISEDLVATVPAGELVRWKAVFDGAPEDAPSQVSLSLYLAPSGSVPLPGLTVRDGGSGMVFYTYDPATHRFNAIIPAGVTPQWTLVQAGDNSLVLTVGGTTVLRVAGGVVTATGFDALGGTAGGPLPRADFFAGDARAASVSADGLRAANVDEGAPDAASDISMDFWERFEFWSAGALTAALDVTGLTAPAWVESATP